MKHRPGLTLIEVLLVIAIIVILASIIIIAINPGKQLAEARNAQRRSDVLTIMDALYQYSIDNDGDFPGTIPTSSLCNSASTEICTTSGGCTSFIDLFDLVPDYVVDIPDDPTGAAGNGAGYAVVKDGTADRLTVCAPDAELGATIEIER